MDSWVLCPCQRSRLDLLKRMLTTLEHPPDRVVIVATQPDPLTKNDVAGYADHVILCSVLEPYISRWWNLGLNYIRYYAQPSHEVLTISSDVIGKPYSVAILGTFLRYHNLTMVGPNFHGNYQRIFRLEDHRGALERVQGCCWMLAGESGLRVDEDFRWWYSDDDFEMQARKHGGTGLAPHTGMEAAPDTPLSEEKAIWAVEDRQKFVAKWGRQPW
jgi:hypothetical protein